MPIFLDPLPSGTLTDTIGLQTVTDLGLTISASGTNTITQTNLDILISKSISRINRRLETTFVVSNGDILPAPTIAELDLIVMQTECLLHKRLTELSTTSSGRGVKRVKLEAIEVEFDSVDKSKGLNAKFGYCQDFQEAIVQYMASEFASSSGDIIWSGNTRRWEIIDHDSTTHPHIHFDQRSDGGHPHMDHNSFGHGHTHRSGH